jgi:hypothetical protein
MVRFQTFCKHLKLIVLLTAFIFRLNPFLLKFNKNKIEARCPFPHPSPKYPILCSVEKVLIYGKSSCLQGILINTYFLNVFLQCTVKDLFFFQ